MEDGIEFWTMWKRISALKGGWTIKGIRCVCEEFVSVLKGRKLLGGTLCTTMTWEGYVLGRSLWKCHGEWMERWGRRLGKQNKSKLWLGGSVGMSWGEMMKAWIKGKYVEFRKGKDVFKALKHWHSVDIGHLTGMHMNGQRRRHDLSIRELTFLSWQCINSVRWGFRKQKSL